LLGKRDKQSWAGLGGVVPIASKLRQGPGPVFTGRKLESVAFKVDLINKQ